MTDWVSRVCKIQPGHTVCVAASFMRQIGDYTAETGNARGIVKEIIAGQAFHVGNLCFINQVNGGDEWLTIKDGTAFESISFGHIIERDGREAAQTLLDDIRAASIEQCAKLEYRGRPITLPINLLTHATNWRTVRLTQGQLSSAK